MWLKVDVSKKACDGELQFFIKMMKGHKFSYKKYEHDGMLLGRRHLFEIFHTTSTVKTSRHVVKSECF